jgi:O-antigen/teichoic acid export membrane protein
MARLTRVTFWINLIGLALLTALAVPAWNTLLSAGYGLSLLLPGVVVGVVVACLRTCLSWRKPYRVVGFWRSQVVLVAAVAVLLPASLVVPTLPGWALTAVLAYVALSVTYLGTRLVRRIRAEIAATPAVTSLADLLDDPGLDPATRQMLSRLSGSAGSGSPAEPVG